MSGKRTKASEEDAEQGIINQHGQDGDEYILIDTKQTSNI